MAEFTHLHLHSHFSLLDGACEPERLIEGVKELGMKSVAMTDHGNIFGAWHFYSAAKAAVLNLTAFLAREWAPKGVRVNSITPGFFPAEQNRKLLFKDDGSPTGRTKSIWAHTPMDRIGESKELIGAAIFLASSKASGFVTGTDIRVDGGFLSQTI